MSEMNVNLGTVQNSQYSHAQNAASVNSQQDYNQSSFAQTLGITTLERDTVSLSSNIEKVTKNKGLFNKIRSFFTGKDYYKTSTGVKITADKNTGSVYQTGSGEVFIDGIQNAKIKGTKNQDTIYLNSSSVGKIKLKDGNDNLVIENSVVGKIDATGGLYTENDNNIEVYNSILTEYRGGAKADNIYAQNSQIKDIYGAAGHNTVITYGGYTGKVHKVPLASKNDVEIHNNPLNSNPDIEWAF